MMRDATRWMTVIAAATALVGCTPLVLDPIGEGGSAAAGGSSSVSAIAMPRAALGDPADHPGFEELDAIWDAPPDTLLFFFAAERLTCAEPVLTEGSGSCTPITQLTLAIPPELVHAGEIDLRDRRIAAAIGLVSADCSGGHGYRQGYDGTLDILSLSPGAITVDLAAGASSDAPTLDGQYRAGGCGDLPAELPPTAGVAIRGANLPAGAVDGTIDPTALYVFAGTAATTCDAPVASIACSGKFRASFAIPAAKVAPGQLDVADLGATYTLSSETSSCDAHDRAKGALDHGQLTITSADAAQVSFRVFGSYVSDSGFAADGVYAATVCP